MALTDRLVQRVLDSDIELDRDSAMGELRQLMAVEAPLAPHTVADSVVDGPGWPWPNRIIAARAGRL